MCLWTYNEEEARGGEIDHRLEDVAEEDGELAVWGCEAAHI